MGTDADSRVGAGDRGSRAGRLGSRKVFLATAVAAIVVAIILVVVITPSSGGSSSASAGPGLPYKQVTRYGDVPRQIVIPEPPKQTTPVASAANPDRSAMEGVPVEARLAGGSTRIFVAGPTVPSWVASDAAQGKLKSTQGVPATYTVSFSATRGSVPLAAADFTVVSYLGQVMHPSVTLADGSALPSTLPAGRTVDLKLTTDVPEGDGAVRWSPVGQRILVSYLWTLEED